MGVHDPVAGYMAFCAVKAVGYTGAAAVISRSYERADRNTLVVGVTRTLIGMAVGAAIYAFHAPEMFGTMAKAIAGLTVLRFAEWWLLLWLFYDRHLSLPRRGWAVACGGVVNNVGSSIPSGQQQTAATGLFCPLRTIFAIAFVKSGKSGFSQSLPWGGIQGNLSYPY